MISLNWEVMQIVIYGIQQVYKYIVIYMGIVWVLVGNVFFCVDIVN